MVCLLVKPPSDLYAYVCGNENMANRVSMNYNSDTNQRKESQALWQKKVKPKRFKTNKRALGTG